MLSLVGKVARCRPLFLLARHIALMAFALIRRATRETVFRMILFSFLPAPVAPSFVRFVSWRRPLTCRPSLTYIIASQLTSLALSIIGQCALCRMRRQYGGSYEPVHIDVRRASNVIVDVYFVCICIFPNFVFATVIVYWLFIEDRLWLTASVYNDHIFADLIIRCRAPHRAVNAISRVNLIARVNITAAIINYGIYYLVNC